MAVEAFSTTRWRSHYSLRRELISILNHALKTSLQKLAPSLGRYIHDISAQATDAAQVSLSQSCFCPWASTCNRCNPASDVPWVAFFHVLQRCFTDHLNKKNTTTSRTCGIWHIKGIGSQPSKKNKKAMTATTFFGFLFSRKYRRTTTANTTTEKKKA